MIGKIEGKDITNDFVAVHWLSHQRLKPMMVCTFMVNNSYTYSDNQ